MAKKIYEETNIQAIAITIREKTGKEDTYKTSMMASGVNEVYDKGRHDERYDFWYKYQRNGGTSPMGYGLADYMFAGPRWNDDTFYPLYNINLNGAVSSMVFGYNGCTDLKKRLEDCGVKIMSSASSGITNLGRMFVSAKSKSLPPIYNVKPSNAGALGMDRFAETMTNLIEVPYYEFFNKVTSYSGSFNGCSSLVRVIGIDFSSATTTSNCFLNCTKLSDITVYGTIPVSISFAQSPLTSVSGISVLTHLKDYASTDKAGTCTVTLKDTTKTLLAELGAIEDLDGKTYDQYITDKGWNLA